MRGNERLPKMSIGRSTLGTVFIDEKYYGIAFIRFKPDGTPLDPIEVFPPKQIRDILKQMEELEKKGYEPMPAVEPPT